MVDAYFVSNLQERLELSDAHFAKVLPLVTKLQTERGEFIPGSLDYTIDVLDDRPPTITFEKPGRDTKVTAVDEVFTQVKATDDYGIAEVRLKREVERADGRMDPASDVVVVSIEPDEQPVTLLPRDTEGLRVDLASLKLEKGDRVRVTVEVVDYRGVRRARRPRASPSYFR